MRCLSKPMKEYRQQSLCLLLTVEAKWYKRCMHLTFSLMRSSMGVPDAEAILGTVVDSKRRGKTRPRGTEMERSIYVLFRRRRGASWNPTVGYSGAGWADWMGWMSGKNVIRFWRNWIGESSVAFLGMAGFNEEDLDAISYGLLNGLLVYKYYKPYTIYY